MQVINDNKCSWINDLNSRTNISSLQSKEECVDQVGAQSGNVARKLGQFNQVHKNNNSRCSIGR